MNRDPQQAEPRRLAMLARLMSSSRVLGLFDQAVVSATSFVVMILLGRWASVDQVGYYAIGFSVLVLVLACQDSLITRPYSIQMFNPPGRAEAHAFASLALSGGLAAIVSAVLLLAIPVLHAIGAGSEAMTLAAVLAAAAPLAIGREFARRYSFAHLQMGEALLLDGATSAVTILTLGLLAATGKLSAATALVGAAVGAAASFAVWLFYKRRAFAREAHAVTRTFRQAWPLGRWFLVSQFASQLQGYAAHWITLAVAGAASTGLYSACLSIVALSNPFFFGIFNVLTPKFVRTLKHSGYAALRREVVLDTLLIGGGMVGFTALIYLGGDALMGLFYPGGEYAGNAGLLLVLALASLAGMLGAAPGIGLMACERGGVLTMISLASLVLGSLLTWLAMHHGGLPGAALGILVTEALTSVARWAFFLMSRRSHPRAAERP